MQKDLVTEMTVGAVGMWLIRENNGCVLCMLHSCCKSVFNILATLKNIVNFKILVERQKEKQRDSIFHLPVHSPNASHSQDWARRLHLGLFHGWQGPKYLNHQWLLPRMYTGEKPDQTWRLWDLKQTL